MYTVAMALKPATPAPMTRTLHGGILLVSAFFSKDYFYFTYLSSSGNLSSEKSTKVVGRLEDSLVTSDVCH